jgi:hypothetical protein
MPCRRPGDTRAMRGSSVVVSAVALAALTFAPAASPTTAPTLRLMDKAPLTVQGVRFDPDATVRVRATTFTRAWTKRVEVNSTGRFVVRFPVEAGGCGVYVAIHAIASDGTRAALRLPHFECPRD